jgi:hypothetical protein
MRPQMDAIYELITLEYSNGNHFIFKTLTNAI